MAYQVYFGDLTEENQGLLLAILKDKEEHDALEPGEADLLFSIRGSATPTPIPPEEQQGGGRGYRPGAGSRQGGGGGGGGRRGGSRRGRSGGGPGGSSGGGGGGEG